MDRRAAIGINVLALVFTFLGAMTIVAHAIGITRAVGEIPIGPVLISSTYGLLALATGVLLFRRSETAPRVFLLWCVTFGAFIVAVPEMRIPLAIPGYAFGLVVLFFIYKFMTRHLAAGPRVGSHDGSHSPPASHGR